MLSLLFCAIIAVGLHATTWEMVEVLLASEHYIKNSQHNEMDDFHDLFDEFAETHGIHYDKRNFRELETNINGLPVAKFGLRNTNCEEFRQFLSGLKAQKYHLQYASVKCGPMTFSFCMAFSCDPYEYRLTRQTTTTTAPLSAIKSQLN